jgi:NodT family efflux transporter outer membrane factor (OMF) lipoprotein
MATDRPASVRRRLRGCTLLAGLLALAACEVGPDYERPSAPTPVAYKESEGWKPIEPRDAANRGPWWSVYNDPTLNDLEAQIDISNQNLKAAEAAFREARAIVVEARAGLFPTLSVGASAQRSGQGPGSSSSGTGVSRSGREQNQFTLNTSASWELDLWGRIRRIVESDVASAQASAGDLAAARLSAQGTLANDYLQLRVADELKRLLDATVTAFDRALSITESRYRQGVAGRSDVASARAQVESTRSQALNVGVQRAAFEHAIAVLIGKPPAELTIAPAPVALVVPVMPTGLPSTLLERRPDIAAAERRVAAANAQIGAAIAAYYPTVTLSASYGIASSMLDTLFRASNAVWSFGSTVSETVFDAGLRGAQVDAARAFYDVNVADYRQVVLIAFQQVEDALAALRILEQQAEVQNAAVAASEEAERLIFNQYTAGTVAYTNVITAQTTALGNEEGALTILQNRLVASSNLIQALGGGWDATQLPIDAQIKDGVQSTAAVRSVARDGAAP